MFPFDQLKTWISKFNGCFNARLRPLKCAFADHPLTGAKYSPILPLHDPEPLSH